MGGWVSADQVASELMQCMGSGRYLVLSHQETVEEVKQAWGNFEGTLDAFAGMNAAAHARKSKL